MKLLMVDAICGVGFPSLLIASECAKVGLAYPVLGFGWEWNREALMNQPEEKLGELYGALREAREEQWETERAAPADRKSTRLNSSH